MQTRCQCLDFVHRALHRAQQPFGDARGGVAQVAAGIRQTDQHTTLVAGARPWYFAWPPSVQHAGVIWTHYRAGSPGATGPVHLGAARLASMLAEYVVASGWRAVRKTEASKRMGRGVDTAHLAKKLTKKGVRHAIYHTLVGTRIAWGKLRSEEHTSELQSH